MEYDLNRFIEAQKDDYEIALEEVREGYKRSHWMWYIFPQLRGLGSSSTAEYYGIDGIEEAKAYLNNDYLKNHLLEISKALLDLESDDIEYILGYPDNLKLKSCMTLFNNVDGTESVYSEVLNKYFDGEKDEVTLRLLKK